MPRPKDEDGMPLPPPHERLAEAPKLREAGVFALAADGRSCSLSRERRLALLNKAIDHVVDGDAIPKRVFDRDLDRPENHFMLEMWNLAVEAIRTARSSMREAV